MNILFLLIPLSLILLSLAVWAFFWAVKHDQFEDLEGPAYSILFDDEDEVKKSTAEDSDQSEK
ncbi:cbb3-type cytochrome oxidase assembly protein CcoS [Marinospirillum sp.]|uniref:cbb3-type cytochrome oxidase assembly protein CcoS n=1 Tax=Marinospirillum sp. TaxID=2183934 RepID=UPI00384CFF5D